MREIGKKNLGHEASGRTLAGRFIPTVSINTEKLVDHSHDRPLAHPLPQTVPVFLPSSLKHHRAFWIRNEGTQEDA